MTFTPGPDDSAPGGPDEISALQFSIDYTGLEFDPTDANMDELPDSIVFNPDDDPTLGTAFQPFVSGAANRIDVIIADLTNSVALPAATVITVAFRIPEDATPGPISVALDGVEAFDTGGTPQPIDEVVSGIVTVAGSTGSPTPSATATTPEIPVGEPTAATSPPPPTSTRTPRPTATPPGPTVGPNTPPPGYQVTVHSQDGGCAIAPGPSPACWPLLLGVVILWRRRSGGAKPASRRP